MTIYELYWGVGYVDTPQRRDRVDAVLGTKEVYDVTPEISRKAGRIAGALAGQGEPLNDPGDELIGATGVVHDGPVPTRNRDHFERIPGLEVETYTEGAEPGPPLYLSDTLCRVASSDPATERENRSTAPPSSRRTGRSAESGSLIRPSR